MYKLNLLISLLILLVPSISGMAQIDLAEDGDALQIHLQYASFDPLRGEPISVNGTMVELPGGENALYLVQFKGAVREEWKRAVSESGARLYDYIPDYAFIASIPAPAFGQIQALPFVRWVGRYHSAYRIDSAFREYAQDESLDSGEAESLVISVITIPDADLTGVAEKAVALGSEVLNLSANEFNGYLQLRATPLLVQEIARIEEVLWVEPYFQPDIINNVAGGTILKAEAVRKEMGLYGQGQIAAVADTGLDVGTTGPAMSDDFEGRIVAGQAICAQFGGRSTWNDVDGHGTHVSGSVLGNGVLSGSQPGANNYASSYAGVAPKARIVFQSVDNGGDPGLECVPSNLKDYLIKPAYDQGARVHNNSWGGRTGDDNNPWGGYNSLAQAADQAAWAYKDMLIVFAAGNGGRDDNSNGVVDPDSIYSPGTAKNVLTVGASENNRPEKTLTWSSFSGFPANPIVNDRVANNINGMAAFSSRGPTDDGRIKPDITAPGTYIISTRSHDPAAGTGWGVVDNHYIYNGGTSMAAPLTSGAVILAREWLNKFRSATSPSAALLKALLINGAANMSPGQYGTGNTQEIPYTLPNTTTGWGRVDLAASLMPSGNQQVWLRDETSGLSTSSTKSYPFNLPNTTPKGRLSITLVWTDYPGSPSAGKALVNDLDLEVIAPDGKHYYGNAGLYTGGSCLRNSQWDACNTVEGVRITEALSGSYTVVVRGANVPNGPQPFALVVTGDCVHSGCVSYSKFLFIPQLTQKR
jgi:hypothetical protein